MDRTDPSDSLALPRPVRLFWIASVILVALCVGCELFLHFVMHKGYPYDWPFIPFYGFLDFFCFQPRFQHFHTLGVFAPDFGLTFMYPAPISLLYQGFYLLGPHALVGFFAITGGAVVLLAAAFGRALVREGIRPLTAAAFVASSILLSYPLWFEYTLCNMEICIFLIVALGLIAFLRKWFYLSAVLIGFAISLKIFPLVYLGLFFSRKRYREMVFGGAVAVGVNIVSLWLLCPSLPVSYHGVQAGLAAFRDRYMLVFLREETGFDHSAFALIKTFGRKFWGERVVPGPVLTAYLAAAVVVGLVLYFVKIRKLPLLNQIVCLSIAAILLPPTSHDYTLLHLYVPLGLLILYTIRRSGTSSVQDMVAPMICFALLVSPESELAYHIGRSGQFKCIVLLILMGIALKRPWAEPHTFDPQTA